MILGTYTFTYTKVDATGNGSSIVRTIIVSAPPPVVITGGGGGGGGGGGSSYVPIVVNTQTSTTGTPTPRLMPGFATTIAPITQSGVTDTHLVVDAPPLVMSSRLKRTILRTLLSNRALQRNRSDNISSLSSAIELASAPVLDMGLLEVNERRVNIRLAPTTDARIIGELKRGDQVQYLSVRDSWIEFQFGDIIGWTKRVFLITPPTK